MDKETERIIKEEILRSAGVGFFIFLSWFFILVGYRLPKNYLTLFGIPFLITFSIFIFLVRIRKATGREFKLKPGTRPYRVLILLLVLYSIRLIYHAIQTEGNLYFRAFWISLFLIALGSMIWEDLRRSNR